MLCENCGSELADDAAFCPNYGNRVKAKSNKNIYVALILTFFITGLGSIYAGNKIKGTGDGGSSSGGSAHYGGVDTSQDTIARNDPDWYYDHYEYGDNPDIDDYLESEGYD